MRRRRFPILSLASLLALPSLSLAQDQPIIEELQEQIRQLQTRIDQLESRQSGPDPRVIEQTVAELLSDADRRSQWFKADENFTAGFANGKFFIGSTDGNWSIQPGLHMQVRYVANYNTAGEDSTENGFEIRRMKLNFGGTAVTTALEYYVQWDTNRDGGGFALDDAFLLYNVKGNFFVKGGQYYDPWNKEQNVGDGRQLAAERSEMNNLIGGQQTFRVQGVSTIWKTDRYRGEVMLHDGANTFNTTFRDDQGGTAFLAGSQDWGATARLDWVFIGKLAQTEDFTPMNNKDNLLAAGAGLSYTQNGDNDAIFHTIDLQYKGADRWAAFASLVGVARDVGTATAAIPAGDFYDWGFLVQGSYMFDERWEVFARYDFTQLDDGALAAGTEDEVHELTLSANYYRWRHKLKFTVDGLWLPNGAPANATGLGILAGDDDQFVLRAQVNFSL